MTILQSLDLGYCELITDEGLTPSHIAAWEGNEETLEWLVKNGADIEVKRSKSQKTPLHLAVDQGHLEIIRILLKAGANVHAETNRGFDALKLAIQYENADIASLIRSYIED